MRPVPVGLVFLPISLISVRLLTYCFHRHESEGGIVTRKLLNAGSYFLIGALAGVAFALWLTKSEVDDARDQLRAIYTQTLNCACKQASQQ